MSRVAFRTDEFKDVKKEFRGRIVGAEYNEAPFGIKGAPEIEERMKARGITKKVGIMISAEEYEKPQYEWFVPTYKTGTRWYHFIKALEETGAMRDIEITGETDEERLESFCKSLVGMEFQWEEHRIVSIGGRETDVLIPVIYYGKSEVGEEVKEVKIG